MTGSVLQVKKADLDPDEYLKRLALHHDVMVPCWEVSNSQESNYDIYLNAGQVAAMKTKQSSELAAVDTLDAAIQVKHSADMRKSSLQAPILNRS